MGVTYKLRDEVVHFIISQRQGNPLFSCRQLAEAASQKFGLNLSKSSVHDVLKESGIVTPRGRKPKEKFTIPQEKKRQIQSSLSKVKLLPPPVEVADSLVIPKSLPVILSEAKDLNQEASPIYDGAGRIFLKAALWDLGIFSEENIKETDWQYYLTYSKGVKIVLENNKDIFIDMVLPLERCIREVADGLVNNVRPLMVHKVSDEDLFKACMQAQAGMKIRKVSIVDHDDHEILEFENIVEYERNFISNNMIFVESNIKEPLKRSKALFFPQLLSSTVIPAKAGINTIENILNLKGFDTTNTKENIVTLIVKENYENKAILQEAVERLNTMFLRDEQARLLKVKI